MVLQSVCNRLETLTGCNVMFIYFEHTVCKDVHPRAYKNVCLLCSLLLAKLKAGIIVQKLFIKMRDESRRYQLVIQSL